MDYEYPCDENELKNMSIEELLLEYAEAFYLCIVSFKYSKESLNKAMEKIEIECLSREKKENKKMKFNEYQSLAKRTINDKDDDNLTLMNFSMGLAGESGETVDYLKKVLFHDHLYNEDVVIKELGDVLWYVAGICTMLDISLDEVAERNVDKLKKRYPEGFNQYNSINREE